MVSYMSHKWVLPTLSRWKRLKYRYEYRVIRIRVTAGITCKISKRYSRGEKNLECSNTRAPRETTDSNSDTALQPAKTARSSGCLQNTYISPVQTHVSYSCSAQWTSHQNHFNTSQGWKGLTRFLSTVNINNSKAGVPKLIWKILQ